MRTVFGNVPKHDIIIHRSFIDWEQKWISPNNKYSMTLLIKKIYISMTEVLICNIQQITTKAILTIIQTAKDSNDP